MRMKQEPSAIEPTADGATGYCERKRQLLAELCEAIKWLNSLQSCRTEALMRDDGAEVERHDRSIVHARELRDEAWASLTAHVTVHGCVENSSASEGRIGA